MATLRQQASKRLRRVQSGQVPPWWRTGAAFSVALGLVVFGFTALAPAEQPVALPGAPRFVVPDPGAAPQAPSTAAPASPSPMLPDTAEPDVPALVQVPLLSGGLVAVPTPAHDAALAAAAALFSGAPVATAPDVRIPTPSAVFSDPVISDLFVHSGGGTLFTFVLAVDPDGPGAEPQRPVRVTLERSGEVWVLAGVG